MVSRNSKKSFSDGEKEVYQFKDEVFCSSINAYNSVVENSQVRNQEYWNKQNSFNIGAYFPQTHSAAYNLVFDEFINLYSYKPDLMDIGCASGEWTIKMAPMCNSIDGFEYSQAMVDTANKNIDNFNNIHFYQSDAKNLVLSKKYDGATILAMLMYMKDSEEIYKILANVYEHLKPGAYLCTRDTLNNENKPVLFLYNIKTGYNAVYWSKELYYEQFHKAGFVMKKECVLEMVDSRRLSFVHIGNIWQKPTN